MKQSCTCRVRLLESKHPGSVFDPKHLDTVLYPKHLGTVLYPKHLGTVPYPKHLGTMLVLRFNDRTDNEYRRQQPDTGYKKVSKLCKLAHY